MQVELAIPFVERPALGPMSTVSTRETGLASLGDVEHHRGAQAGRPARADRRRGTPCRTGAAYRHRARLGQSRWARDPARTSALRRSPDPRRFPPCRRRYSAWSAPPRCATSLLGTPRTKPPTATCRAWTATAPTGCRTTATDSSSPARRVLRSAGDRAFAAALYSPRSAPCRPRVAARDTLHARVGAPERRACSSASCR